MTGPILLRTTAPLLVGLLSILSIFMLVRGHHSPGGGFAGGLILASAVAIQLLAHGVEHAHRTLRVHPLTLVGIGLLLAVGAATLGPLLGKPVLAPVAGPTIPNLTHLGSVTVFDVGVYLIVAGMAVTFMFALLEDR